MNLHDAMPPEPDVLQYLRLNFVGTNHWEWDGERIGYSWNLLETPVEWNTVDYWSRNWGERAQTWVERGRPPGREV